MEPKRQEDCAVIMEFKVRDPMEEKNLEETASEALLQIERKKYAVALESRGIALERIRKYGFAFEGKTVLIKKNENYSINSIGCRIEKKNVRKMVV